MIKSILHSLRPYTLLFLISTFFYQCIEPFDAEFENFESAIVVEATITNEIKLQQVLLTRTFEFEADATAETNADVRVIAGGTVFNFEETDPGVYLSSQAFAAQSNTSYQLQITTQDGRTYSSNEVLLPPTTQLDALRAERITDNKGADGIAILADSFDPTGSSMNYRYTYEETYQIIAPDWTPVDLAPDFSIRCGVTTVPKTREERVCYATNLSNDIILANTSDLEEDRVSNFMVRFINRNNFIISHRYSILVRQLVQSKVAFTFYETLEQFSNSESLFSETQPGFLEGNVSSELNDGERVLGFFDVASVTEQRIFFNYSDFYPDEPLPPFVDPCNATALRLANEDGSCFLQTILQRNAIRFLQENPNPTVQEGPFFTVPRVCGDCTVLGKIEVPEFWIE